MSELSCGTRFIGRNETLDLSRYQNKCAKSPREHFIDPQTQATFFVWENGHFQHLEMLISQHRRRSKGHPPVFRRPGSIPIAWYECHPFDLFPWYNTKGGQKLIDEILPTDTMKALLTFFFNPFKLKLLWVL